LGFLSVCPAIVDSAIAGLEEAKNPSGEKCPLPDSDPFNDVEFGKISPTCRDKFAASADRRSEFQKCSQLFVGVHNKAPSVVAERVSNKDCLPVGIDR